MEEAIWRNGSRTVRGRWQYNWASDTFTVILDSIDRITRQERKMIVHGDKPEWGKWKLVREKTEEVKP